MKSWSSGFWNTKPTALRMSDSVSLLTGTSPMRTLPRVGVRMPLRCISSVDLPAPFAPTIATDSPWPISNETLLRAGVPSG